MKEKIKRCCAKIKDFILSFKGIEQKQVCKGSNCVQIQVRYVDKEERKND